MIGAVIVLNMIIGAVAGCEVYGSGVRARPGDAFSGARRGHVCIKKPPTGATSGGRSFME